MGSKCETCANRILPYCHRCDFDADYTHYVRIMSAVNQPEVPQPEEDTGGLTDKGIKKIDKDTEKWCKEHHPQPEQPAEEEMPICAFCGLPLSKNNHPDAGKPDKFLDVGTVDVCIPCLVKNRNGWKVRALKAEAALAKARKEWADKEANWLEKWHTKYLKEHHEYFGTLVSHIAELRK